MPRLLFEKTGKAVWMSHLDLMRLFQRSFKRAGLQLSHTNGYNPRPSVSIALPLSVGVESCCELLDFDLLGEAVSGDEIRARLNDALVEGVRVLDVYDTGAKIGNIAFLRCTIHLYYQMPVDDSDVNAVRNMFCNEEVLVEKKTKNGVQEQNIIPMIRSVDAICGDNNSVVINALICCQNPTLNPNQIVLAVEKYLPHLKPVYTKCRREEIFDKNESVFR